MCGHGEHLVQRCVRCMWPSDTQRSELERRGLPCGVYDIALNPAHDLLGRTGFKDALQLGLRPGSSKLVADSAPFPRADQEISGGLASRMHGAVCRLRADGVILAGPPCSLFTGASRG